MKQGRIRLVAKTISRGPAVLIISGERDLVASLTERFRQRNCRVYHVDDLNRRLHPCDYVIFLGEEDFIPAVVAYTKRSRARLAVISHLNQHLRQSSYRALRSAYDSGINIRLGVVDLYSESAIVAQVIEEILLSSSQDSGIPEGAGLLPTPPLPIPSPPPPVPKNTPIVRQHKMEKTKKRATLPKKKFLILSAITGIFILLLSPFIFTAWQFYQTIENIRSIQADLVTGQLGSMQVALIEDHIHSLDENMRRVKQLIGPLTETPLIKDLDDGVVIVNRLASAARHSVNLAKLGQDMSSTVFADRNLPISQTMSLMKTELEATEGDLNSVSQSLDRVGDSALVKIPIFRTWVSDMRTAQARITEALSLIRLAKMLLPSLPQILGLEGKRVYLLLFQNNMELRPTGGFIGSYGLVTFDRGRLIDLDIEDVYTADGQLRGHVDPPEPLKKYLFAEHWYLRDSNFEPNFPQAVQQVEWFLHKEVGTTVDGVVAVDLTFAKRILDAFDGINLPDYGERITSDNFFLKAQVAIQENFFPGSTQKRDFLGHFARALLREFTGARKLSWLKFGHALKTSLDEKHVLVSLHDKAIQEIFDAAGWSGRLLPVVCSGTTITCHPDYFFLVDTNVGVNKANYYLKRSVDVLATISRGEIERVTTITYQNETPSDTFPSGPYRNYLRTYIPKDAGNIEIFIDDEQMLDTEYTLVSDHDKLVLGFYLEAPVKSTRLVKIKYKLFPREDARAYQLITQKQPGTENDRLRLEVVPRGFSVTQTNFPITDPAQSLTENPLLVNTAKIAYNSDLSIDRVFTIILK